MIYEATIQYTVIDRNGNDRQVKEQYVLDDWDLFAEAEAAMYNASQSFGIRECDVVAIKRSNVKEIIKKKTTDGESVWCAEVMETMVDDNGVDKEMRYKWLFYSMTFDSANQYVRQYMQQGYENMELVGLKRTRIKEIIQG